MPIISAATQARREAYFRIEWRLAAQRTQAMSDDTAFLLPVVIDATRDAEAKVPAEFKIVQSRIGWPVASGTTFNANLTHLKTAAQAVTDAQHAPAGATSQFATAKDEVMPAIRCNTGNLKTTRGFTFG